MRVPGTSWSPNLGLELLEERGNGKGEKGRKMTRGIARWLLGIVPPELHCRVLRSLVSSLIGLLLTTYGYMTAAHTMHALIGAY